MKKEDRALYWMNYILKSNGYLTHINQNKSGAIGDLLNGVKACNIPECR